MKTKCFTIVVLMLCMSTFLFPATAYAYGDENPPIVTATVDGEVLRIEASGGYLGIETIYINEQHFNYPVDGVLSVDLLSFSDSKTISIYAVDFAENTSNIIIIENPLYIGLETQPDLSQGIPVTPTPANPFTPAGQATVIGNASSDDGKEFFTFTTPAGNVFFLVIDRQRDSDNVYFLNAVTEYDLIALADQSGQNVSRNDGIPVSTTPQTPDEWQPDESEPTEPDTPATDNGGNNNTMIFILVAVAIAGGAGYYFKVVRPKQQASSDYDDEDEDEEDIGEEMEFADEPEESGEDSDGDHNV